MVSETFYTTSDEWHRALTVAEAVKQTASGLQLQPRHAWLRQVLNEAADQMRSAVLWAAQQGAPDVQNRHRLRPLVVAADATRSDASLASYFLSFLRHEGLIDEARARDMASQLSDIELSMTALSEQLRSDLGFDPYEPDQT
jgi:hypothetical protein